MKKYNLYIVNFKELRRKEKIKREITKVKFYDKISFDLANYFAVSNGCALRFLDKKGNVSIRRNAEKAIGYGHYDKVIAFITPNIRTKKVDFNTSIYPDIYSVTLSTNMIDFSRYEKLINDHENSFFDYSIDAANIWGPSELIPIGFINITEGLVQEGDYYWDYNSFKGGHFIKCDVSFSPLKVGREIEYSGREENEVTKYCNQFIIRKIIE